MPFGFRFAANVGPIEWADCVDTGKSSHYFSSSGVVLLRETHLSAADNEPSQLHGSRDPWLVEQKTF